MGFPSQLLNIRSTACCRMCKFRFYFNLFGVKEIFDVCHYKYMVGKFEIPLCRCRLWDFWCIVRQCGAKDHTTSKRMIVSATDASKHFADLPTGSSSSSHEATVPGESRATVKPRVDAGCSSDLPRHVISMILRGISLVLRLMAPIR